MSQARTKIVEDIVCQSSTIYERNKPPFVPLVSDAENLVHNRLDAWRRALDEDGRDETLQKYLRWQGISAETAFRMLAPVRLEQGAPLPAWAQVLEAALAALEDEAFWEQRAPALLEFAATPETAPQGKYPSSPPPFAELLTPFLEVVHRSLSAAPGYDLLSGPARQMIAFVCLKELAAMAADVFYRQFQSFREKQPFGALILPAARAKQDPPNTTYKRFVDHMKGGGLLATLQKYPVLARLLSQLTLVWINTQADFLIRLAQDLPDIERTFQNGANCGPVSELALSLSDRHAGGYSVTALTFAGGLKLVYKPKDVRVEAAYNRLLAWLNDRGAPVDILPLQTLARPTHGWVAFAKHNACRDRAAIQRFYERTGALLALLYALEATDCHEENVIACGEYPVLVDAETLFHHRVEEETTDEIRRSAAFEAAQLLTDSVLRVGLLPGWRMGGDRKVLYDGSGLGGLGQDDAYERKRLTAVNTDAMEFTAVTEARPPDQNAPFLEDGRPFHIEDALDVTVATIEAGFEKTLRFLIQRRAELTDPAGILALFADRPIRFVFRATQVYHNLSVQARRARNLQDGADYALHLERLARAHLQTDEKPACFPLLDAERQSLTNLDIPFFSASTSSADIVLAADGRQKLVRGYFLGPSYASVIRRLQNLSENDLTTQLQIIRGAMFSRFAPRVEKQAPQPVRPAPQADDPPEIPFQAQAAFNQALEIARRILAQKITGRDGSSSWFGVQMLPESGRYQFDHLGPSLYDGLAGIGLFFAALHSVLQLPAYRADALPSLRAEALACALPIRQALQGSGLWDFHSAPLGGANGIGSSIYALLTIGKLIEEPALIEEASAAARQVTPERFANDETLDMVGGSAGFILSLSALYEETQDARVLEQAVRCADALLTKRLPAGGGLRAWKTAGAVPLSGFSHGAAGFAAAFLRLYRLTGASAYLDAAEEALAFEDTTFSVPLGNWRDLREGEGETCMTAWCHGAAGIGLQRAAALDVLDTPRIRQDLEAAVGATQKALSDLSGTSDHLCCGNLGRVEALFSIGRALQRPDLVQAARRAAARVIQHAAENGGYKYASYLPRGQFAAGFFQGGAGIGYGLLRLSHPDLLPNVLIWE